MKIIIDTKFNVGDIVYTFNNDGFNKFEIKDIVIEEYGLFSKIPRISYKCVTYFDVLIDSLSSNGEHPGYIKCCDSFYENQLYTKDELVEILNKVINE